MLVKFEDRTYDAGAPALAYLAEYFLIVFRDFVAPRFLAVEWIEGVPPQLGRLVEVLPNSLPLDKPILIVLLVEVPAAAEVSPADLSDSQLHGGSRT